MFTPERRVIRKHERENIKLHIQIDIRLEKHEN